MTRTEATTTNPSVVNDLGLTAKDAGCACCAAPDARQAADAATAEASDVVRGVYLVDGMTCSHCVSSVTEELAAVDGVQSVSVDLKAGDTSRVTVVSTTPIPVDAVRSAVTEAGYDLIDA